MIACVVTMLLLNGCNNASQSAANAARSVQIEKEASDGKTRKPGLTKNADSLVYQNTSFSSYSEKTKRGAGIVSFNMDVNDRLDIWNMDDTKFGDIVLNEDLTFFTVNLPKKITARKVVPEYDFAAFDFDAEKVDTDPQYLIIYVNKEKRKVKKTELKFTFNPW
ncbi:hypothetical protein [Pedobacter gandavensis]|uniref:hypothetical protein n=1 Tax=Pedobacter gandavensis TaxID=2679963 RepID=UPI00292DD07B|nr:hypothetical protein [Pedobacter gandavensis]